MSLKKAMGLVGLVTLIGCSSLHPKSKLTEYNLNEVTIVVLSESDLIRKASEMKKHYDITGLYDPNSHKLYVPTKANTNTLDLENLGKKIWEIMKQNYSKQ